MENHPQMVSVVQMGQGHSLISPYVCNRVMDAFSIDKRTLIQVMRLLLAHFIREALICRHGFIYSLGIFMM